MPSGSELAAEAARKARGKPQGRKSTGFKITDLIGGLIAAQFSKEKGMGRYSKFFGTLIGSVVGIGAAWLAVHVPLIASCAGEQCTVLGISADQITVAFTMLFGSLGTFMAPPNA